MSTQEGSGENGPRIGLLLDRVPVDVEADLTSVVRRSTTVRPPIDRTQGWKRLGAAAFAILVAVSAGFFVWTGLPTTDEPMPQGSGNDRLVPSGGSYELIVQRVDFPVEKDWGDRTVQVARVIVTSRWTTPTFPGEAPCTVSLFDDAEEVVLVHETGLTSLTRPPHEVEFNVPVDEGRPVDATAECGPGLLLDSSSRYVFSNLRTDERGVIGDISWSNGTPVGTAACAVFSQMPDQPAAVFPFTIDAGPGTDQRILLTGGAIPAEAELDIRCEPFREPGQMQEDYWSRAAAEDAG